MKQAQELPCYYIRLDQIKAKLYQIKKDIHFWTLHVLDPLVSLTLWVDHQWPTTPSSNSDAVFSGESITWQTLNVPVTHCCRLYHEVAQVEVCRTWNSKLSQLQSYLNVQHHQQAWQKLTQCLSKVDGTVLLSTLRTIHQSSVTLIQTPLLHLSFISFYSETYHYHGLELSGLEIPLRSMS